MRKFFNLSCDEKENFKSYLHNYLNDNLWEAVNRPIKIHTRDRLDRMLAFYMKMLDLKKSIDGNFIDRKLLGQIPETPKMPEFLNRWKKQVSILGSQEHSYLPLLEQLKLPITKDFLNGNDVIFTEESPKLVVDEPFCIDQVFFCAASEKGKILVAPFLK